MKIQIQNRRGKKTVATSHLEKIVRIISAASDFPDAELSILITDDAGIRQLNRQWRHEDQATDVLSFAQLEGVGPAPTTTTPMLGDIVISLETATRQAKAAGHSLEQEARRLLVHGFLHLLGHDHVHGGHQARKMKQEERRLLALLTRQL